MHLKARYLMLLIIGTLIIILYKYFNARPHSNRNYVHFNNVVNYPHKENNMVAPRNTKYCDMSTCFDFDRCQTFTIYIYPQNYQASSTYTNLLNAIKNSKYITNDSTKACILIPSLDTLDRDPLSPNFLRLSEADINKNAFTWNNGKNHLIFNMYSGTYPDYSPKVDINIGQAIYIAANLLTYDYRYNFDLSLPLFNEQFTYDAFNKSLTPDYVPNKKYLLTFKGKRYLYGYGSETRNALYHLHDGKEIILLTTCRHGDGWEKFKDDRCDYDNSEYDKYDYQDLLVNSTFCLVPRGRRLASYRFLEVLRAGCIPVVLSNGWMLPFSEVIDWSRAAIVYDERMLFTLGDLLYSIPEDRIMRMRAQVYTIYENYFSSFQSIVDTILEILKDRVFLSSARPYEVWNSRPGALWVDFAYSRDLRDFPFYTKTFDFELQDSLTATILVSSLKPNFRPGFNLHRLITECSKSANVSRVVLVWISPATPPTKLNKDYNVPLSIYRPPVKGRQAKFWSHHTCQTDAILCLDENETIIASEMDFGFSVWKSFPQSLVGFRSLSHYTLPPSPDHPKDSKDTGMTYRLNAQTSNSYSMVSTTSVIYHRYYNHLYNHALSPLVKSIVAKYTEGRHSYCAEDIAMNMLVTSVTGQPPIKVGARDFLPTTWFIGAASKNQPLGRYPVPFLAGTREAQVESLESCFNEIVESAPFLHFPLIHSIARADPLLYKDNIKVSRKKYAEMELIPENS